MAISGYNFSDAARRALQLAREAAGSLGHETLNTGHQLLGLLRARDPAATTPLTALGVDLVSLEAAATNLLAPRRAVASATGPLPFSEDAKRSLEGAMTEARELGHSYVGSEHLLLGLLREGQSVGARALAGAGVTSETLRAEVQRVGGGAVPGDPEEARTLGSASALTLIVEFGPRQLRSYKFRGVEEAIQFLRRLAR